MRLDQELVQRGLCESRQEAQEYIKQGFVLVDGVVSTKQTKIIHETAKLIVTEKRKFVGRGGHKLEGALLYIFKEEQECRKKLKNLEALDVGSSTGGFTNCLLSYGVSKVVAVDVGTSQMHPTLRDDTRVELHENTDIRMYNDLRTFDIIVADVSFIALEKIIDAIIPYGRTGSIFFLLIKPQFEVGFGNTKKGIVKEDVLVDSVLTKYKTVLTEKHLIDIRIFPCSISGGDGNQEYFAFGVFK